jgi:uncharacterized protein YcbX
MSSLSGLFVYPVKSLGGVSLQKAQVQERGLQFDRRWMVVDKDSVFLTQRHLPQMATIAVELTAEGLSLHARQGVLTPLTVGFEAEGSAVEVQIWRDVLTAREVSAEAHNWLSEALGQNCRLVQMPEATRRPVDSQYAHCGEITSFSDGFPFLILGQASLDDLNFRLEESVPIDRFRTNFLFEGGEPFDEDSWGRFRIGEVEFEALKPCSRCVITTTDQGTGERRGIEPLRTLATYRMHQGGVYFAQNAVARSTGTVRLGDGIEVLSRRAPLFSP